MKLLNKRLIFLLSIFLVSSCSSKDITSKGNLYFENTQLKNSKYSLKGKIDFSNFRIKSDNAVSFVLSSTVSLLYPSNYSNQELRNTTIGTNISDVNHNFTINPISGFTPELNQIYILEASRRVYSNEESPLIALRTNVLWDGTTWKSITQPSIIIGKETTTISIYADLNPTLITSNETINRINTTTNPISITFDSKLKANIYNQLLFNVRNTLSNGQDPVEVVYPIFFNQYNLPNKRLQSNMHLFQTILETYGVDWAGFYPNTFQQLKLEASSKGYYKTIKNPFSNLFSGDATMDYSEYTQAQNTLNFRGNVINSMQDLKGYVIYIPKIVNSKVVSYFIYGTDFFGDFMPTQDGNYYLTNN